MDAHEDAMSRGGEGPWRIGELAERTGLSVRTLHHYDQIGLVPPSHRTGSGHRRYTGADVARLHAVIALHDLGLSLADAKDVIDTDAASIRAVLREQLAHLDEQIHAARGLRHKVAFLLDSDPEEPVSIPALFALMEAMVAMTPTMSAAEYEAAVASRASLPAGERGRLIDDRRARIAERGTDSLAEARAHRDRMTP